MTILKQKPISNDPVVIESYKYCLQVATNHYENFPIITCIFPKNTRYYLAAIYAFARIADDLADEGELTKDERMKQLIEMQTKLQDCYNDKCNSPLFIALHDTINACNIPIELFINLLTAFKSDVLNNRHQTFTDLINYSHLSTAPIGRLVLLANGVHDQKFFQYADNLCVGLQLTNFWQDIAIDADKNRIYLPLEDLKQFQMTEQDILSKQYNANFCQLMKHLILKTRPFYIDNKQLFAIKPGKVRYFIKMCWLGGYDILNKIEKVNYDVYHHRPQHNSFYKLYLLLKALGPAVN